MLVDDLNLISPVSILQLLGWSMGQGTSKDKKGTTTMTPTLGTGTGRVNTAPASKEDRKQQEKEAKQQKAREKKELKERQKKEKLKAKAAEKEEKERQRRNRKKQSQEEPVVGGKSPKHRGHVREGHQTNRSKSSQTTMSRIQQRLKDGDDISLDPVDNSPDYDDDTASQEPFTPQTPTERSPDQLTQEEIKGLIARVKANDSTLTTLTISGQIAFKRMSKEAREEIQGLLADAFQRNTHVTKAILCRNHLDDAFAVSLADALTNNTTLESLNLDGNEISGVGAQALANTLSVNTTIKELFLKSQDAKLGVEGEETMLAIMEQNKTLVKLEIDLFDDTLREWVNKRLSDNFNRRSQQSEEDASAFDLSQMQFVLTPIRLQVMALVTNNFDEATLDFSRNDEFSQLTDHEKAAVASGIGTSKQISTANLSNTQLVDGFAQTLALSLPTNDSLTSLNIEGNFLTEEGVKAIAETLKTNSGLKELRIGVQSGSDSFGTECSKVVADCLEANKTLTKLVFKSQDAEIQVRIDSYLARNAGT